MKFHVLFGILIIGFSLSACAAEAPAAFTSIGYCCTGFGVPGTGQPLVIGAAVLVSSGEGFATVCDVKDPFAPRVLRYIPSWYFTNATYPLLSGNKVYLSNSRGPLLILDSVNDIANRGAIRECAWDPKWGRSYLAGIAPDGIGYTVVGDTILVIDFNDPRHLLEKARIVQPRIKPAQGYAPASLLMFSKDFRCSAVMLDSNEHVGLFTWKSRTGPVLCSEIYNRDTGKKPGTCSYGTVVGLDSTWLIVSHSVNQGFAGQCTELTFWNISDLSHPRIVCDKIFYAAGTMIRGMAINGSHVYISDGRVSPGQHTTLPATHSRLITVDLDSLDMPVKKSLSDSIFPSPKTLSVFEDTVPGEYSSLTLDGNRLYINDYNYGLRIFDISDPHMPKKRGDVPTAAEGHWLYMRGDHAFMAHTFGGTIHVINVKDPAHPATVGYYWDGHWLNYKSKIRGRGNAMYLPQGDRVAIVDISNPFHPGLVGEVKGWGGQHIVSPCMDIVDKTLFITEGPHAKSPGQLLTFDITDPLKPVLQCTFD
jgi:hypothetical protein